jgi:type II secretory ATPase GspE/PulE/Tfp pilus assembly ATPase PilB-like protein
VHGEGVVIRILYRDTLGLDLNGLGMPDHQMEVIRGLLSRPNGLILVTGPTGSGKTTTLYAALRHINIPENKIITIEDPVEYRLPGVNQIQVNPQVGLTFAAGLRSIVRQDPDVVLVGEIRDRETADIAIHASLTGHLVFSTLHTNDAPGAVTRLQDMGVDSFLISSSLMAALAQRLVRVLCPECKQQMTFHGGLEAEGLQPGDTIWRAVGCQACGNTGYRGRTAILELMMLSEEVKDLINRQADSDSLRKVAMSQGMRTLRQDGWDKVRQGVTSLEEVLRVTT